MNAGRDTGPWNLARRILLASGLLLLIGASILRSSIGTRLDSFTVDEPWHIVAGSAYVRGGDYHLNPEHPPLVKLWVGMAMPGEFILRPPKVLSEKTQERTWVEQTMFQDNDAARAQQRARMAMWSFHAALLFALGLLLWRACGWAWAAGTLAFLALEPTVAAHLPVVMTDLPLALTFAIATVCAGLFASNWQWRWAGGFGVALGLMLGAKHSALAAGLGLVVLLAIAALGALRQGDVKQTLRRMLRLVASCTLAVVMLWALYGFHFHAAPDGSDAFNRTMTDKIAEVSTVPLRETIAFADRRQLLPRAYLWGLADTVRTGVEGRGIAQQFVWGRLYDGHAPWFTWPAILLSKLPLALLALALLGAGLRWRARGPESARWVLVALFVASAFHLAALMVSPAAWGGVRHATPLIVAAAILGGAAVAEAWRRRSRIALAGVAALFVAASAMTLREPRLWEYHNELVGGSAGAYRYFTNEGLDLGQRFAEIRAFHDRFIAPGGEPMYVDYWMGEEQIRAAGLHYHRRVESLEDTNVAGTYQGWFVYTRGDTLPWPQWDWNPDDVFKELRLVAQFGNVGIWHGRQVRPRTRASSLSAKVMDYIYKENGSDWALVALRLEEVVALMPQKLDAGVELGNAWARLGDGTRAVAAYRRMLEQKKLPLDPPFAQQLRAHIERIEAGAEPSKLEPLRNPWLE
jgi:hypothetical protein